MHAFFQTETHLLKDKSALKKEINNYHGANHGSFMLILKGTCILIEEALLWC